MRVLSQDQANQGRVKFQQLPAAIRDWLTSVKATEIIADLNQRYSLRGEDIKIIPVYITRLMIGLIAPKNFTPELKEALGLPEKDINNIVYEIKQKILNPIADGLKNISGINLGEIPGPNPQTFAPAPGMEISPAPKSSVSLPISKVQDVVPAAQVSPALQATSYKLQADKKPFMLHEETPVTPLPAQPAGQRESFSYHVPINYKPETRPAPAKFGASFEEQIKKPASPPAPKPSFAGDKPKVVHYHSYRSFPFLTEKKPLPPQK